jgi:nucleotide-binding universal stress UspA family protein
MPLINRILVPIDFSPHSRRALQYACELSKKMDASLVLIHAYAIPAYTLPEGYIMASPATIAEIMTKIETAMGEAKRDALAAGARVEDVLVVEGIPFAEIVRAARDKKCDLIIMGTHGRTGLKHALLGSVAEKVVRKAPCAVLTVRDEEHSFVKP